MLLFSIRGHSHNTFHFAYNNFLPVSSLTDTFETTGAGGGGIRADFIETLRKGNRTAAYWLMIMDFQAILLHKNS
jgi:hypothetical protein